ncbi:MAG: VWA domain-containing protein [Deltaproteobacteria bacterium]|nr:VWA domain-containing protein [Deltaproteobacteria bacterium]
MRVATGSVSRARKATARRRRLLAALASALGVAAAAACQSGTGLIEADAGTDGGTGTGGGGTGGDIGFDAGPGNDAQQDAMDPDAACATSPVEATRVPVNMFIMFDKSGSMANEGKWTKTSNALQAFFAAPASAGLRVALRFFPHTGCDQSCNVDKCAQPAVPLGELSAESAPQDAQEMALINAFVGVSPSGGTPLSAALEGALVWGQSYLAKKPTEKAVVVLVTDGAPSDCNTDLSYIVKLAGDGYDPWGVLTFAIGLEGCAEDLMSLIAVQGGTEKAAFIGSANAEQELLDAMNHIRDTTVACEFLMPKPEPGKEIDPKSLNVVYKSGEDGEPTTIGQVPSAEQCTPEKKAWYYDDAKKPTKIIFCDSTCATIREDKKAKIEIVLGCTTVPA